MAAERAKKEFIDHAIASRGIQFQGTGIKQILNSIMECSSQNLTLDCIKIIPNGDESKAYIEMDPELVKEEVTHIFKNEWLAERQAQPIEGTVWKEIYQSRTDVPDGIWDCLLEPPTILEYNDACKQLGAKKAPRSSEINREMIVNLSLAGSARKLLFQIACDEIMLGRESTATA